MHSNSSQDCEWLRQRFALVQRRPSVDEIDYFCERVAIIAQTKNENEARNLAFKFLLER